MKKIYSLALLVLLALAGQAQRNVVTSPARRTFTRAEITPMEARRQERPASLAGSMRNELLNEDFDDVLGTVPAALPAGWSTPLVTDNSTPPAEVPAFAVHTSASANNGDYWPVPITTSGNRFAGANDDGEPCDCDMMDVWLQSPELDFTGATNVAVTFDIFHDGGFDGGNATLQVSTDGGDTFTILPTGTDGDGLPIENLPLDPEVWQTIIVPVYDLSGESSVIFRWQWSDDGSWASGFAVDNIIVGELPDYDLKVEKVKLSNWNQETFSAGFWDYSRVPLTQVSPIAATAVVFNKGRLDQTNASVNFEVEMDGSPVPGSPFAADQVSATLLSLDKDTISVVSDYIPMSTGTVDVKAIAVSESGDDALANNHFSNSLLVTENEYARDANSAQAFVNPEVDYEFGNLFDIYQEDVFGGVLFAVGSESEEGATIQGRVYEWVGLDEDGLPVLDDTGIETIEYDVQESDLNSAGEADFIFLPFADGNEPQAATLEGGKTYLVTIASAGDVRVPVSGSNEWVVSWLFDGEWGATLSIPMIRLTSEESLQVDTYRESNLVLGQNAPNPADQYTMITYSLRQPERVSLTVRDMSGRVVMSREEGLKMSGNQSLRLETDHLGAGVYSYTLTAGGTSLTRQMVVR